MAKKHSSNVIPVGDHERGKVASSPIPIAAL